MKNLPPEHEDFGFYMLKIEKKRTGLNYDLWCDSLGELRDKDISPYIMIQSEVEDQAWLVIDIAEGVVKKGNCNYFLKYKSVISYAKRNEKVFMKQLLCETKEESVDKEEVELLEEKVRMYECIVNFIHNPGDDVIYMAQEETCGYNICWEDNDYRLSEKIYADTHYFRRFEDIIKYWEKAVGAEYTVCVDMVLLSEQGAKYNKDEFVQPIWFYMSIDLEGKVRIRNFGITEEWFEKKGFSEKCVGSIGDELHSPLPFEHGSRIKLKTPEMLQPVYGILDSSEDCYGRWYHFLCVEDEEHDFYVVKKLMEEDKIWGEYNNGQVDIIDLSSPQLDRYDKFLTYDWIERADEVGE